jgi:hypothetical protein
VDELELLEDELELLDEELELLLEELDDELEEELLLDEPVPLQLAACGLLPLTVIVSMFAKPALCVDCRRMRWLPAFKLMLVPLVVLQLFQAPVPGKLRPVATVPPFTINCAVRLAVVPLAWRQAKL